MAVLMLQWAHNGICCVLELGVDILGNRINQTSSCQCPTVFVRTDGATYVHN